MTVLRSFPRRMRVAGLALVVSGSCVLAQPATTYEPREYQEGKDVVWVPTALTLVNAMLDMAKVTAKDYVVDLGSGDGRTVITAAKRGAKAMGVEYNPDMVALSKRNAEKEGVSDRVTFVNADLFETDFSQATVVTLFLLPELNLRLRPRILDMKPGTRVASNSFDMGDWKPDQTMEITKDCKSHCRAHFWVVPAKVDGTWQLGKSKLALKQKYQTITGTLSTGNVAAPLTNAKLNGDEITFTARGVRYTGRVNGDAMEGARTGGKETAWRATRS
jgi:SAM-dependent methyltransferase